MLRGSGYSAQHPVSIAFSNRVLDKIDKETSKEKRSRREYAAKKLATTPKKLIKSSTRRYVGFGVRTAV
jgi:ribosomal protein L13E